jgi:hypothetical protein
MSLKTRIEALEKRLAKPEPEETVIIVRQVVVRTRDEVDLLRAAGLLDPPLETGRAAPRGPVRLVVRDADLDEVLEGKS